MLDPEYENLRKFGSAITQQQTHNKKHNRFNIKRGIFVKPSEYWPKLERKGHSMEFVDNENDETTENVKYFSFTHGPKYRDYERIFYTAILSHDPNQLSNILMQFPYHVNCLLQMSEVYAQNNDITNAAQLVERALYIIENSLHPSFNLSTTKTILPYEFLENRPFYLALNKHCFYIMRRGCWRTALEINKTILRLDPNHDPLFCLLTIDYLAIKAKEFQYLIEFVENWKNRSLIESLPNFSYSLILAKKEILKKDKGTILEDLLFDAFKKFPIILIKLIDKCSIVIDKKDYKNITLYAQYYQEISKKCEECVIDVYTEHYIHKSLSIWKETDAVKFLTKAIPKIEVLISKDLEKIVEETANFWLQEINTEIPLNLCRNIFVSAPELIKLLPKDIKDAQMFSHDPIPPPNSTSLYDDYQILQASRNFSNSNISGAFSSLYTSLNNYLNTGNQNQNSNIANIRNLLNQFWPGQNNEEDESDNE